MSNILSTSFNVQQALADDRSDRCEHVEADSSLAYAVFKEDDSFGPVGRYVVCRACYDQEIAEEQERTTCCFDCKQQKKNSVMLQWRWYDFYAAQGDVPYDICQECWDLPKHQQRMESDHTDRMQEEGLIHDYWCTCDECYD